MPVQNETVVGWGLGILTLIVTGISRWVAKALDAKVSKDQFKEFKQSNEREHDKQNETLSDIWGELKEKKDK